MTPDTFLWQATAFVLFRFFDITKPQPARYFDQHVKNGFGVMADDLVAAGYTLLCLALLKIASGLTRLTGIRHKMIGQLIPGASS